MWDVGCGSAAPPGATGGAAQKERFAWACFALLARYRALQVHDAGGGNQGSIPPAVFRAIEAWAGEPVVEGFASPLNSLAQIARTEDGRLRFHSAFVDTDRPFGSRGDFFAAAFESGVVEVNPPFDEAIIARAVERCEERSLATTGQLAFVLIIPEIQTWRGWERAKTSAACRRTFTLAAGDHWYLPGAQHARPTPAYRASRNTTVFVFASARFARGKLKVLERRVTDAFRQRPE